MYNLSGKDTNQDIFESHTKIEGKLLIKYLVYQCQDKPCVSAPLTHPISCLCVLRSGLVCFPCFLEGCRAKFPLCLDSHTVEDTNSPAPSRQALPFEPARGEPQAIAIKFAFDIDKAVSVLRLPPHSYPSSPVPSPRPPLPCPPATHLIASPSYISLLLHCSPLPLFSVFMSTPRGHSPCTHPLFGSSSSSNFGCRVRE